MGLGLYLHIPFCKSKCHYCDFCSMPDLSRMEAYLNALETEAALFMDRWGRRQLATIFIGGGTPTLLTAEAFTQLARMMERYFDLSTLTEWTVEGNPESVGLQLARHLRQLGVNRFSMGVQSLSPSLLKGIGRIHSPHQVEAAVEALRKAGFENLNLDLMTGLPGQTLEDVDHVLSRLMEYDPEHISAYGLKIEEGTHFARLERQGRLALPDEALERRMEHRLREVLTQRGYQHYEISNYAKSEKACRHNLNYWNCGSYAALGLSSHGYLDGWRFENTAVLDDYFQALSDGRLPMVSQTFISHEEDEKEWLMLRLRLSEGILFDVYQSRYGKDFLTEKKDILNKLLPTGWIRISERQMCLTEAGFDFANAVMVEFI